MGSEQNTAHSTTNKPMKNFSSPVSFKLDEESFLPWKQQAMAAIMGHKLKKFQKKGSAPRKYATEQDEVADLATEEYPAWKQQHQLLMTWLLASINQWAMEDSTMDEMLELWFT